MRIEGIGSKAIEELEEGLKERDLMYVIENDLAASKDDMSQLLDMVFSPDDTILLGGDTLPSYNFDDEDMLGEALPPRNYRRNPEELDALLGGLSSLNSYGFNLTDKETDAQANAQDNAHGGLSDILLDGEDVLSASSASLDPSASSDSEGASEA